MELEVYMQFYNCIYSWGICFWRYYGPLARGHLILEYYLFLRCCPQSRDYRSNLKACGRGVLRTLHRNMMATSMVIVTGTSSNTFEAATSVVGPTRL